jgi:Cohesin loading factor
LIWQYSFLLIRLQHIVPNPDTHEITQYTNTVHNLRSLSQQNSDHELLELSYLLEIRHALQFNLSSINIQEFLSLATETSNTNPLRQNHMQLSLMRMLLHILYLMKLGNGAAATAKLREHHHLMDSTASSHLNQWRADGKFDLLICNGAYKLHFQWFSQAESFVFGYLLSGVVNLPDYSSMKAWNFHEEGVRVVDSASPLQGFC